MSTITAKIQIYVSDFEKKLLSETMRAYSSACNMISSHIFLNEELKQKILHNEL
jgi:predicted transposase